MATIIPAILASSEEEVAQKLLWAKEFAEEVQIDIVDGVFASPASWPYTEGFAGNSELPPLPQIDALRIQLDLMVDDPERTLATWLATGATSVLFHVESTLHMKDIIATMKREYGYDKNFMTNVLSIGLAINQNTALDLLEPYLEEIDYVQFMGIKNIGKQGQPFSRDVSTKIQRFREKHPDIPVQVDGGVSLDIARELLMLGVTRLVVGSGIWNAKDPRITFLNFQSLVERYGIYE